MVKEGWKIEVTEDIAFWGIDGLCYLLRLIEVLRYLLHLLNEKWIIPRIFNDLVDSREDLRRVACEKAAEVFWKNLHTVGFDELEVQSNEMLVTF